MKIFISWSGSTSQSVAEALHDWLPRVIQAVQPWLSSKNIDKGARWSNDIATQLDETKFGLICLTRENMEAPWILFEAGALSKTLDRTYVCPYLFNVDSSDLKGPLVQFQTAKAEKEDTRKLVLTINRAQGATALADNLIEDAFEIWWPKLEQRFLDIPNAQSNGEPIRSERELLEEMLELVRSQARKSIELDKGPLYNLLKAEINDFKSHILKTMTNKDTALLLEESRLTEEIYRARLAIARIMLDMAPAPLDEDLKPYRDIEHLPQLEATILHTKSKLEDLRSRAATVKPETLKDIDSLYERICKLHTDFLNIEPKSDSTKKGLECNTRKKGEIRTPKNKTT